jgi:hypothetical protein
MNERDDFSLDSMDGIEPERKPCAPSANRSAKAKAALTRQRIRAAAGLVHAFSKVKAAGGKVKTVGGKVKAARKAKCPECGHRLANSAKFCAVWDRMFRCRSLLGRKRQ